MRTKRDNPPAKAEEIALRLLGLRDYSREEMRRKLTCKGLNPGEIEEALKKLEGRGLIDDRGYGLRLAAFYTREKLWGAQRVMERLLQKGIALELARDITDQTEEQGPARERIRRLLRLKLKGQGLNELLPQEKRRLVNHLRQRGFLWDDIMEALQEAGGSTEE